MNKEMDAFATDILSRFESLIDEEVETKSGATLLVHHINGNENNQLVVGTSRKGKSIITRCPVCGNEFFESKGVDVEQGEVCCSDQCASEFETL